MRFGELVLMTRKRKRTKDEEKVTFHTPLQNGSCSFWVEYGYFIFSLFLKKKYIIFLFCLLTFKILSEEKTENLFLHLGKI